MARLRGGGRASHTSLPDRGRCRQGRLPPLPRFASFTRPPPRVALAAAARSRYQPRLTREVPGGAMAEPAGDLVVETVRLTKIYQNRQIALNDVSLRLEPGCVLGLLGPNGA